MSQMSFETWVHPHEAYRLEVPAHWERQQKDEGASCGFGPRERDDVGLWISILPMSVDTPRLKADLPALLREALAGQGAANLRPDPSLRHFALKADMTAPDQGGHYWILTGGDLVLFASTDVPPAERDVWGRQFDRVMASLEITRERELFRLQAAIEVLEALRRAHPEQGYALDGPGSIRGALRKVSLAGLFRRIERAPRRDRRRIVRAFVDGLEEGACGGRN